MAGILRTDRLMPEQRRRLIGGGYRPREAVVAERQLATLLQGMFQKQARSVGVQLHAARDYLKPELQKAAVIPADVGSALSALRLRGFAALSRKAYPLLRDAYRAGALRALGVLGINRQQPAGGELWNEIDSGLVDQAQVHAAELVGMRVLPTGEVVENPNPEWAIDDATRGLLRADVVKLFTDTNAEGEPYTRQDFVDKLKANYAFSGYRARMIARTEISSALVQGQLQAYADSGQVAGTIWVLGSEHYAKSGDTDECDDYAAMDMVPLGEEYAVGLAGPPAHPNCVCGLIPVTNDEAESGDYKQLGLPNAEYRGFADLPGFDLPEDAAEE